MMNGMISQGMISLSPEQASQLKYPPGCPVYICSIGGGGDNETSFHSFSYLEAHGKVDMAILQLSGLGLEAKIHYSVVVESNAMAKNEKEMEREMVKDKDKNDSNSVIRIKVPEKRLRYRTGCTVAVTVSDGSGGTKLVDGIVRGVCDISGLTNQNQKAEEDVKLSLVSDTFCYSIELLDTNASTCTMSSRSLVHDIKPDDVAYRPINIEKCIEKSENTAAAKTETETATDCREKQQKEEEEEEKLVVEEQIDVDVSSQSDNSVIMESDHEDNHGSIQTIDDVDADVDVDDEATKISALPDPETEPHPSTVISIDNTPSTLKTIRVKSEPLTPVPMPVSASSHATEAGLPHLTLTTPSSQSESQTQSQRRASARANVNVNANANIQQKRKDHDSLAKKKIPLKRRKSSSETITTTSTSSSTAEQTQTRSQTKTVVKTERLVTPLKRRKTKQGYLSRFVGADGQDPPQPQPHLTAKKTTTDSSAKAKGSTTITSDNVINQTQSQSQSQTQAQPQMLSRTNSMEMKVPRRSSKTGGQGSSMLASAPSPLSPSASASESSTKPKLKSPLKSRKTVAANPFGGSMTAVPAAPPPAVPASTPTITANNYLAPSHGRNPNKFGYVWEVAVPMKALNENHLYGCMIGRNATERAKWQSRTKCHYIFMWKSEPKFHIISMYSEVDGHACNGAHYIRNMLEQEFGVPHNMNLGSFVRKPDFVRMQQKNRENTNVGVGVGAHANPHTLTHMHAHHQNSNSFVHQQGYVGAPHHEHGQGAGGKNSDDGNTYI